MNVAIVVLVVLLFISMVINILLGMTSGVYAKLNADLGLYKRIIKLQKQIIDNMEKEEEETVEDIYKEEF